MPVKSLFVPNYALQGEDVPAHIIWESLDYDHIRIQLFPYLFVNDVFNAKYEFDKDTHIVTIKEVEMEGYVGLVFGSKLTDNASYKGTLVFSFIGRGNVPIYRETRKIEMFRYKLNLSKRFPEVIEIDPVKKFVHNKIPIENQGNGTVLLKFLTSADSELQRIIPDSLEEIKKKFDSDLHESFSRIKKEFTQYSELIDEFLSNFWEEWDDYDDLRKGKLLAQRITEAFLDNEKFFKAFWIGFGEALSKNINMDTLPERILSYLNSLAARKIILLNPGDIVKVYEKGKILNLELMPTDLLLNEYSLIKLPPVKIIGTQEGEIEIFKLFRWEES